MHHHHQRAPHGTHVFFILPYAGVGHSKEHRSTNTGGWVAALLGRPAHPSRAHHHTKKRASLSQERVRPAGLATCKGGPTETPDRALLPATRARGARPLASGPTRDARAYMKVRLCTATTNDGGEKTSDIGDLGNAQSHDAVHIHTRQCEVCQHDDERREARGRAIGTVDVNSIIVVDAGAVDADEDAVIVNARDDVDPGAGRAAKRPRNCLGDVGASRCCDRDD